MVVLSTKIRTCDLESQPRCRQCAGYIERSSQYLLPLNIILREVITQPHLTGAPYGDMC